jgi:cobalt-zinc-cadmium efflux system outer membrane protein
MKKLLVLFITFIFASFLSAADDPGDANSLITLNDYLQYALANNAGLKSSLEQWNAAKEQIPQAKSLPDPQLSFGYATESTPQRSMFDVMQPFPWFGTIDARTDAASARAQSAQQQFQAQKLQIIYQVKQAFYDYCYLSRAVQIAAENVQLARHFEEIVRIRYAVSSASHPDIIRSQIERAKFENDLASLEKSRPALVARLNGILNRPASSPLAWPKTPQYKPPSIDSNSILALVVRNNPQLWMLKYDIDAASFDQKLARKKFYPDIGLGVGVDSGMGRNGSDRVMAKVSITLPIWRDNYTAAERQAKAQIKQTTQQKIQLANDLLARAKQIIYELENGEREIQLYRDTIIPKTKQMLAASESAYQANTIDFLSLIDSLRALLDNQLYYQRAVFDNAKRLAEIEMLAGTELPVVSTAELMIKDIEKK